MATTNKQSKYEELEQIRKELAQEAEELRSKLKQIEGRAIAVALAIEVWKSKGTKVTVDPYLREFKDLTQVQALTKIAKDSGNNRFRLNDAKKILLDAGLVKSKKNASTILFTAIQRSEKFKRVAPGEYELIEAQKGGKPIAATLTFQTENLKRVSG
jgi:hypothetical protein